jgi:hypothetical protein
MRSVTTTVVIAMLAVGLAACATPQGAYLDKDEPENRLLSSQMNGTVARVDPPQQVVVLDNGQMYRVSGPDAVYVGGRPVALSAIQPGSTVTIISGTPVYYQNGQYVTMAPTTGAVVATPGTVVTVPPAAGTVRIYGRVVDVDRNEIKIRTQDGHSLEVRMPTAGTAIRKGDPVTLDMTFGAAPSASPR